MTLQRRRLLLGAAGVAAPAFLRHARAADEGRFDLGIASGQPHAQGMVLWTRLTGRELPDSVPVDWEVAEDEAFRTVVARGTETAVLADAHCVHAEPRGLKPARDHWYRFSALGQRSTAGRTRTAPEPGAEVARFDFAIASCQRWDVGHYAAWRDCAAQNLDAVLFLGDYIYEYGFNPRALRPHQGGKVRTLADYRRRYAQYKSDPLLQAAHAAAPWLLVWDDHEVDNDYAGLQGQDLQPDFAQQRAAAYQAYWEHMPLPKAARPVNGEMRMYGQLDWGRLARILMVDDRQYRDVQVCPKPGRGGSNTLPLADCPAFTDPRRTLLGAAQEDWLAQAWSLDRPWNLLAQQTLMARFSWRDVADRGGEYWTDGWDGYQPARKRLLEAVATRRVPGTVVLGGDVHANYVADLKVDFDDAKSPVIASEFCGTSISSLGLDQSRVDKGRTFNPHVHHARADERGYVRFTLQPKLLQAELRVVSDARDPASVVFGGARFIVEAGQPGPQRVN
jgi:alkaline phosphatase D